MTIRKTIHPEPLDVDVEISLEDVMRTLRESPDSTREATQVLNCLAVALKGITEEMIEEFTPAMRSTVRVFLMGQVDRFKEAAHSCSLGWRREPPDSAGWWWRYAYGGSYMCMVTNRIINPAIGSELVVQLPSGLSEPVSLYTGGGWWSKAEPPAAPENLERLRCCASCRWWQTSPFAPPGAKVGECAKAAERGADPGDTDSSFGGECEFHQFWNEVKA